MAKNYRLIITSVVLYEMLMVFIFLTGPVCDLIFKVCGLQYFIFGILIPVVYYFIYMWRDKISQKNISEKRFLCIITVLLFLSGVIYWIASPSIIDFSKIVPSDITNQCINTITVDKKENIESYAIKKTWCREITEEMYKCAKNNNQNYIITKRQQKRIIKNVTRKMRSYISMSCEAITNTEIEICRSKYNDPNPWGYCTCYGSYLAYLIKKNYNTDYNSEQYLNQKLIKDIYNLRMETEDYCNKHNISLVFPNLTQAISDHFFCGRLNEKL